MEKKYRATLKDKNIFVKETTKDSIVADSYMWGSILFSFWFNYQFIGGNNFVDLIIFICIISTAMKFATSKIITFEKKEELIEYLEKV